VTLAENFILCTIHRAENTDDPDLLSVIIPALNKIFRQKELFTVSKPCFTLSHEAEWGELVEVGFTKNF